MYISMYINWINIFPSATNSLLKKKVICEGKKKITHFDWSETSRDKMIYAYEHR